MAVGSQSALESAVTFRNSYNLLKSPTFTNNLLLFLTHSTYVNVAKLSPLLLDNDTRVEIYNLVKANPDVQFRGICNQLGLSIVVAQFHLGVLIRAGLVSLFRDGKYKQFFESKQFSKKQMKAISILRHETAGSILKAILERTKVPHGELVREL